MSNNQNPATHHSSQLTIPLAWQQFIAQILSPRSSSVQFPKPQVISFCQSQKCPKVKQLLTYLHPLHKKYKQNCVYFKQLLILLYILLLKGCASISTQFISICMNVLQQLLKFRIIVICYSYQHNVITEVYSYLQKFISILVPSVFMWCDSQQKQRKNNRQKQKISQKQKQTPIKIITILQSINKTQQIDNLLIIFQCLLVVKIRNHLAAGSLFQFDSIMRKMYTEQKYKLVYQGKGYISHIFNKQKQKIQKQKQLATSNTIVISKLIPARNDQLSWQVCQLQLKAGNEEQNRKQKILISKIQTEAPMQQWVVNAFKSGLQPNKVPVVFNTFLTKMKAIEMYRFLCLLEIYGSSPNIQVLNQYIPDEKILQIFTKFLLGENLVEYVASMSNKKQIIDGSLNRNLVYSYKNEKLLNILQLCMNQANKIKSFQQKNIFFEEFKTRFLKKQQKNNQQKYNNNDDAKQIQGTVNKNNLSTFQHNGKKLDDYWKK